MGSSCKTIDWNKPLRRTNSSGSVHKPVTIVYRLRDDRHFVEWPSLYDGLAHQAIVDTKGHLEWSSFGGTIGDHYVENVPEEPYNHLILYKSLGDSEWKIDRGGLGRGVANQLFTKSDADRIASGSKLCIVVKVPI